jgi:general secretion pathway protein G
MGSLIKHGSLKMKKQSAFTLIELTVVMAMIALILTIALPRYFDGLLRSKEAVLQEDLAVIRKAIDDYHADTNRYPNDLETLVNERYIQFIPTDPITERNDTWVLVRENDESYSLFDIHSGAKEMARNGTFYSEW